MTGARPGSFDGPLLHRSALHAAAAGRAGCAASSPPPPGRPKKPCSTSGRSRPPAQPPGRRLRRDCGTSSRARPPEHLRRQVRLEKLPGKLVRKEGEPATGDPAADEAYDGLGHTHRLYADVFGRNSIDGGGLPLDATVHFGKLYDNAFWDGQQMVFGDGDGEVFERFTRSLSVIGHELTHGVTQFSAGLAYRNQAGAINESMSDVFGALVEQYVKKQSASRCQLADRRRPLHAAGARFSPAVHEGARHRVRRRRAG